MAKIIDAEFVRQDTQIELIASENFVSKAVMAAAGSVLTNKYAEGYPHKRYYGGCEQVDWAEEIAIARLKQLFGCVYANVQPHSGSQANQAVFLALLQPGDTILAMDLSAGGHLTHGAKPNLSGKWFDIVSYGVDPDTCLIDYDEVAQKAHAHKPKLIICGASAYTRVIDFQHFRKIADEVGAYLMADVAHYAGLIAAGLYPSPVPHAHVVTSTTHKTLRGPRGGVILCNDEELGKKFNSAIFPGLQGGPLMHIIAAKAVAFGEALQPSFKTYQQSVIENAKAMAQALIGGGVDVLTGGTDCHAVLVDLRSLGITGKAVEEALDPLGITCNKNGVPFDPQGPRVTSGIRLGSPAMTTRGLGTAEFTQIGTWIAEICHHIKNDTLSDAVNEDYRQKTLALCRRFPLLRDAL